MERMTLAALICSGLVVGGLGCSGGSSDYKKPSELTKAPAAEHHDHGAKGPHGGSIVELGEEEYHGEVVLDDLDHKITVYIFGKDAKIATPIPATELTVTPEEKPALTLKAAPQKDEPEGKSSRFELVDEAAVHSLLDAGMIHGDLGVKIGEKAYKGHIDYHLDGIKHEHKDDKKAVEPAPNAVEGKPAAVEKPSDGAIADPK